MPDRVGTIYATAILKKLRKLGVVECTRKGVPYFVWTYVPHGEPKKRKGKAAADTRAGGPAVTLKHMGSYRVRTLDGRQFDRLEFCRRDMTWSDRRVVVEAHEVAEVAYIPDHAAYKSGSKHLDIYAHQFVPIEDCIVPKLKAAEEHLPKWVHPIRARALGLPVATVPADRLPPDPSNPFGRT